MKPSNNIEEQLKQLLEKDRWSDEEKSWLLRYLEGNDDSELRSLMEKKFKEDKTIDIPDQNAERLLSLIHARINAERPGARLLQMKKWKGLSIAASILLLIAASIFVLNNKQKDKPIVASTRPASLTNDIAPGHDNAILTLADRSTIVLNNAENGALAKEGSADIMKQDDRILYTSNGKKSSEVLHHTLSTARGNQYHLQLADGSRVWLNAASSIRFPTSFPGTERRVQITGEVYFEVAHNPSKAFIVEIKTSSGNDGEVRVLGTHFNINAYDDEAAIKTTLAEGKLQVKNSGSSVILEPSYQAIMNRANASLKTQAANLEKELAWRNSMFEFQDDDLPGIMRQLSRWYDVEVSFAGVASKKLYNGSIRREATLSQVFQILKLAGISYTLEGRKVTVRTSE